LVDLLKQRVITAIVMALFISAAILFMPVTALAALLTVLVLIASWEWAKLAGLGRSFSKAMFALSCLALMVVVSLYMGLFTASPDWLRGRDVLGLGCLWWALALLWVKGYPGSAPLWGSVAVRCVMGWLTLLPAWLALIYLRQHDDGIAYLFILIGLVACADIGAFFAGRAFGKAKLAPAVSPAKSWAGFWGGVSASCGFALLLWAFWGTGQMHPAAVLAIALFTALASVLGDLLESMVKRHQGVKDSGTILPGHGGIMDRIDSITAAAPVFALSLLLVGW
jgi:phosphatidate cytidylyltransferase